MASLKRIAYYSKATTSFGTEELVRLAVEAGRFNALDGLNGVLFYADGRFAQIFEGVDDCCNDLLARLGRDTRHHDLQVVIEETIKTPLFHTWDMHLAGHGETCSQTIGRLIGNPELPAHIADFIDNFAEPIQAQAN